MKVLVTGGSGFIGSHLVNYLKSKGHWVRSVDVKTFSYLSTVEDEFLQVDLREKENAEKAVEDVDWVFNLAADMGGIGYITEYNAPIMKNNVLINVNMLEASRNANVKRFFFSSSACVYPRYLQTKPSVKPLKESDVLPAYPDSAYGWEKLFTEFLCLSYHHDYGLETRIARFHNIYGPYTTYKGGQEKAPAALCRKVIEAKDGTSIIVWGDGEQTRSFTYITDCLDAVYKLMQSDYDKPINIGVNDLVKIDDLARMVIEFSGKALTIKHDLTKPQGVRGRNADTTLVGKVLQWKPSTPLNKGMRLLYDWIEHEITTLMRF